MKLKEVWLRLWILLLWAPLCSASELLLSQVLLHTFPEVLHREEAVMVRRKSGF